jgi:hypothetical protein
MHRAISSSQAWRSPRRPSGSPHFFRTAVACGTSLPRHAHVRAARSNICRNDLINHIDKIDIGAACDRDRRDRAPTVVRLANNRSGQVFLNELGRASITRESVTSVRFPYRQSSAAPNLDGPLRRSDHAARLQSACWSCARHSFVPAKSRSAAARNNGRGQVGTLLRVLLQKTQRTAHASSSARCFKCHGRPGTAGRSHTQGRPIVSLHRRSVVLVGMARHHVRRRSRRDHREGDAPSFLMPRKDDFDSAVVASDMPRPDRDRALAAVTMSSDDRERGRSSALFPAKSLQADTALADISNHDRSAEAVRSIGAAGASPTTSNRRGDGLFMLRSSERRPR